MSIESASKKKRLEEDAGIRATLDQFYSDYGQVRKRPKYVFFEAMKQGHHFRDRYMVDTRGVNDRTRAIRVGAELAQHYPQGRAVTVRTTGTAKVVVRFTKDSKNRLVRVG